MTSSPPLHPPIEKARETQLLHVQSKVDHSAYSFPSATGWQSSKKSFTAKCRMGFRRSCLVFLCFGWWECWRIFEDGIWNPCRCVWWSFDWLFANSFKMDQCKMSVIPVWMRTTFFTQPMSYLQYPNKNHHSWLMLPNVKWMIKTSWWILIDLIMSSHGTQLNES